MPESRKRKPKRTPRPSRPPLAGVVGSIGPFELLSELDVAQRFRPDCSQCHAPIAWSQLADASESARLPSQRAAATRFTVERGLPGSAQYWACTRCDECGVFGPMTPHGDVPEV